MDMRFTVYSWSMHLLGTMFLSVINLLLYLEEKRSSAPSESHDNIHPLKFNAEMSKSNASIQTAGMSHAPSRTMRYNHSTSILYPTGHRTWNCKRNCKYNWITSNNVLIVAYLIKMLQSYTCHSQCLSISVSHVSVLLRRKVLRPSNFSPDIGRFSQQLPRDDKSTSMSFFPSRAAQARDSEQSCTQQTSAVLPIWYQSVTAGPWKSAYLACGIRGIAAESPSQPPPLQSTSVAIFLRQSARNSPLERIFRCVIAILITDNNTTCTHTNILALENKPLELLATIRLYIRVYIFTYIFTYVRSRERNHEINIKINYNHKHFLLFHSHIQRFILLVLEYIIMFTLCTTCFSFY